MTANPMTIACPVCMAPAGVPCNTPTERGRRNVAWFHFKREESVPPSVQSTEQDSRAVDVGVPAVPMSAGTRRKGRP